MSKLYVISGPSGVGKDTVIKKILEDTDIKKTVSVTTRMPRVGEVDGDHYHFVLKDKFEEMIVNGEFLEYATVHGNMYGTSLVQIEKALLYGQSLILAIDVQGGINVKQMMKNAVLIFLSPPSMEELKKRLNNRATDNQHSISLRLKNAEWEMGFLNRYDYQITNDTVENAVIKIKEIIEKDNEIYG